MNQLRNTIVAPSILSADFARIGDEIRRIENSNGDWVHLDVMDGVFVPNLTFGPKMVSDIRKITRLPLDVHLMIINPENMVDNFAEAGADFITFHLEACTHVHRLIEKIHGLGKKAGISIVPSTPASHLNEILQIIDLILIMSVNPGAGGQKLIPQCLEKVRILDRIRKEKSYSYYLSVDGGIDTYTAASVREAGTDILVTGSAFFATSTPAEDVLFLRGKKVI
ncbi:MAG: ribulose-phosphate 3-epimerase [Spirochaetota bacterium]